MKTFRINFDGVDGSKSVMWIFQKTNTEFNEYLDMMKSIGFYYNSHNELSKDEMMEYPISRIENITIGELKELLKD